MDAIEKPAAVTKRQERGAAREKAIVSAAAELITERGLANIRVTDVAQRAGMSTGHVTYYFRSKTVLLMRAIQQSEDAFIDEVEAKVHKIRDPWKRLTKFIELSASNGTHDPGWVLWFEVWANAALDPEVATLHEELDARSCGILAEVIRYGCERGAFASEDPELTATLLSASIDGLSIQLTLGAANLTGKKVVQLCLETARALLAPADQ
ncbi:TetR/AcrR family transcriptional regulator [Nocardioides speluncae]|uniref:TetR/AcrR family transcriptional regulator n=1 Tax=Nocardioides speluncae TaxID=2670337 RepID=UPI000D6886AF|nr:TetR family transcriptional regulator C-terminal domain-containing protein [Nocardioides speluncae]